MSFLSGIFLTALVVAAGPTIIHLLNRRRRRTIHWAAMDFLREVIKRNRRILQLRDLLLLLLRTVAVILFVLAMARPYWLAGKEEAAGEVPMHAVLVIDNSLSMGYKRLDKSLLDEAKAKARTFIEALPAGSEISVIPLCSHSQWHARNVYAAKEDALEAVERIEIVDRSARAADGFARVRQACLQASDIPTKRVVFLSDMQDNTWSLDGVEQYLEDISDVQIVQLAPPNRTNTWVESFELLRGIADTDSTAVFRATIRHEGEKREHVQVSLKINGAVVKRRHEDLISGHSRQLDFRYKFDVAGTSAEPQFVPASIEVAPDRLPMDDSRTLIVPVVARVPVVFIDQLGSSTERPKEDLYGETYLVRKLISSASPRGTGGGVGKQLVRKVRRAIHEITRDDLKDARLVVIAGVKSPTPRAVSLLREYVEQGGQLFLAAGGEFDPVQWTAMAWRDGAGIMPAPLRSIPVGSVPAPDEREVAGFRLDEDSLVGDILPLVTTPEESDDVRRSALFYKIVVVDEKAGRKAINNAERKRIKELEQLRKQDRRAYDARQPNWLAWTGPQKRDWSKLSVDELVSATQLQVMGRYKKEDKEGWEEKNKKNKEEKRYFPFVVQRDIGKGRVVMLTSGLWPSWNTLALENSVLVLDRILRSMMLRSLPPRTFGPEREIVIPVDVADPNAEFEIETPDASATRTQTVEARRGDVPGYDVVVRSVEQRGVYRVRPRKQAGQEDTEAPVMMFAVNGPSSESELASKDKQEIPDQIGQTNIRWLEAGDEISLVGKAYIDPDFWKVLMIMALACLGLEMLLLGVWTAKSRLAARDEPGDAAPLPAGRQGLPETTS